MKDLWIRCIELKEEYIEKYNRVCPKEMNSSFHHVNIKHPSNFVITKMLVKFCYLREKKYLVDLTHFSIENIWLVRLNIFLHSSKHVFDPVKYLFDYAITILFN